MKRSGALAPLSRDHHHALVVAQRLRRADARTAAAAREAFLSFWETEGSAHFRIEEELLLPAYARHGSSRHEAVVRVLTDHVELRRLAADLGAEVTPDVARLHDLGERLHGHIRHEERVLFPLVEAAVPPHELDELAKAMTAAERAAARPS